MAAALVLRTAYNNQDWKAPCNNPWKDSSCHFCFREIFDIEAPKKADDICSGHCLEQHLCVDLKWGCTPKGRIYGDNARTGVPVIFVFKEPDGRYTIWGRSNINSKDSVLNSENGFAFIHFNPFKPLPRDKWVTGLSDVDLVGAKWLQGRHRYIGIELATKLDHLIEGKELTPTAMNYTLHAEDSNISAQLAQNVLVRLNKAAREEGRTKEEIIREAIAEWLRIRGI
jgi:hypothetical protein